MDIPKIAYGVSGYNSDASLIQFHQDKITKYINDFEIIGSRDRFTHQMVTGHRTRSDGLVEMLPDPTFLYEIKPTGIGDKLSSLGVDLTRPILGTLLFGNTELAKEIQANYTAKGYQILALSMYNPYADINLGHLLDPFEWAEVFQYLNFCVSDRFHGTLFCLKNHTLNKKWKLSKMFFKFKDARSFNCNNW